MIKAFCLSIILLISLDARENPFFPSSGELEIPFSSNENRQKPVLKNASIELPSQARILKKVTVEYKSLDGSIQTKSIELDNSIDWHLPLFISQSYSPISRNTKIIIKEIKHIKNKKTSYKKLLTFKHSSFYSDNKTLKIVTKDKLIRNFLLINPHRIVLDFDNDTSFKTIEKKNKNNKFCKIRIGNHSKYYRVVIELDGFYKYNMKKVSDGYLFKLK